jgi:folate-binding protein YgfZ
MMSERTILRISGADARKFLQNLVSNDVKKLDQGMVYAALLTPQGKYLCDFFLVPDDQDILIDIATDLAGDLTKRLTLYRLRADVTISPTDLIVAQGLGSPPSGAFADPRHPDMGWRSYGLENHNDDTIDWNAQRVALGIPEYGAELGPESYILEMGFARLNGVDFRKGCYVGQEVTARMKHKTELRKGLARITFDAPITEGDSLTSHGKAAGSVHTVTGQTALCYLRFDRATDLTTGTARATDVEFLID